MARKGEAQRIFRQHGELTDQQLNANPSSALMSRCS